MVDDTGSVLFVGDGLIEKDRERPRHVNRVLDSLLGPAQPTFVLVVSFADAGDHNGFLSRIVGEEGDWTKGANARYFWWRRLIVLHRPTQIDPTDRVALTRAGHRAFGRPLMHELTHHWMWSRVGSVGYEAMRKRPGVNEGYAEALEFILINDDEDDADDRVIRDALREIAHHTRVRIPDLTTAENVDLYLAFGIITVPAGRAMAVLAYDQRREELVALLDELAACDDPEAADEIVDRIAELPQPEDLQRWVDSVLTPES